MDINRMYLSRFITALVHTIGSFLKFQYTSVKNDSGNPLDCDRYCALLLQPQGRSEAFLDIF